MQLTSVTNPYTVSKLIFIGPRDTVYFQFSAHRSEKSPRLSAKAKQAKFTFIKSEIVCTFPSKADAAALYANLFEEHRLNRLCINISRRCNLQDSVEQAQAFDECPQTIDMRASKFSQTCRDAQKAKVQSIKATPWLHPKVKGNVSQSLMWSKADEIFDHWLTVDGVSRKGGYKAINTVFTNRLFCPVDTWRMLQLFKTGWNPNECLDWQVYYN
jgi:hypothetical protein